MAALIADDLIRAGLEVNPLNIDIALAVRKGTTPKMFFEQSYAEQVTWPQQLPPALKPKKNSVVEAVEAKKRIERLEY